MKVLAINSSNRKKHTYQKLKEISDILYQNEIEIIHLYDYDIQSCTGCEYCLLKGECVLCDDVNKLMHKIKESDALILSSPVYIENVSGKLKTFFDRTCVWFHRPELYGKPMLVLATTKGSGLKRTLKYLNRVVIQWGGFYVGKIGRTIGNIDKIVSEKECKKLINHLKIDKSCYKPSLSALTNFQVQKVLSKKVGYLDQKYWEKMNWYNSIYYFDCNINFLKKIIAHSFGAFLDKVINK